MTELFSSCFEKQENVKLFFSSCKTPQETYEKIIEFGRIPLLFPENEKKTENLVAGCQSQVFLYSRFEEGKVFFSAFSEALISAGLTAMLVSVYSGESPETILSYPPHFLEELGIQNSLTLSRSNGLASIHLRMKQEALKFLITKKN